MIDIHIEDVTGATIPVDIEGQDTGGCAMVFKYPTNLAKYSLLSPVQEGGLADNYLETLLRECFVEFNNPISINGKPITLDDILKYKEFAKVADECVKWISDSLVGVEKN